MSSSAGPLSLNGGDNIPFAAVCQHGVEAYALEFVEIDRAANARSAGIHHDLRTDPFDFFNGFIAMVEYQWCEWDGDMD
jgi:hypothetical protein